MTTAFGANLAVFLLGVSFLHVAVSQSFVGVNYGELADNLPPPEVTARLLQSTTISKVRLYGVNPALIRALAGTGIEIMVGTSNSDIAAFAGDPAAAAGWVKDNVAAFMPASVISTVSVGNEVFYSKDAALISQLAPAMRNLHAALAAQPVTAAVKVSTVHAMSILRQSDPPSSGAFDRTHNAALLDVLAFLNETSGPFMVNPYPYFAYQTDPRPETLAFCLFQPNAGRPDAGSGVTYMNMFDAQVAAVRAALAAAGFPAVKVLVAETGWPHNGSPEEAGATAANAAAYNGNLVKHLKGMGEAAAVVTYIFALYDENLKGGSGSEKFFGLYKPDGSMNYDVGLLRIAGSGAPTVLSASVPAASPREAAAPHPTAPERRQPAGMPPPPPSPPPPQVAAESRCASSALQQMMTFVGLLMGTLPFV